MDTGSGRVASGCAAGTTCAHRLVPEDPLLQARRGRRRERRQDGERDTVVQEPPLDVGAAVLEHGEADLRARGGEPRQRAGEEGRTETRRGEQRQAALVEATGGADRRARGSDRGEDLAGVAGEDLAGVGDAGGPAAAVDQA